MLLAGCWWQYRLCFLVHGLSPTPSLAWPCHTRVANGANHCQQCFSNPSNIRPAGLSNSQSHLSLLVFPSSQEKSMLRVYSVVLGPLPYTTHMPRLTVERYRGLCSIRPTSQLGLVVEPYSREWLPYRCVYLSTSCCNFKHSPVDITGDQ